MNGYQVNYFEAARLAHPIGLLLAGAVLADIAEGSHSSSLSRRTLRSIATWLALVLLFSFFALSLVAHRSSPEAPLWIGLQFLLGISLIAAVADHDPRRTRIVAGTALALWIVLLSHMVITLFNNTSPLFSLLLGALGLLVVAVVVVPRLPTFHPSKWLVGATVFVLLLAGLASTLSRTTTPVSLHGSVGRSGSLSVSSELSNPALRVTRVIRGGVVSAGLGHEDRPLEFAVSGTIAVSKPNYHQDVRLRLDLVLGYSPSQRLILMADGVPAPNGSLQLAQSRILLSLRDLHVFARGKVSTALSDAIFGTLDIRHHKYSMLLTYSTTSPTTVHGSITIWPNRIPAGKVATLF